MNNIRTDEAVLIPGGGVRAGGKLPVWITARLDLAIEIGKESLLIPLSAGTPHRAPPLDENGFPITEARAAGRYLVERGVDPARIRLEESSYDTIGNGFFSRVCHAIPGRLRRIVVVTSEFHMPRVQSIFEWVYGLPGPGEKCDVSFRATANVGITPDALRARLEKEQASLASFLPLRNRIASLAELYSWFFSRHQAYAVTSGPIHRPAVDLETY